MTQPSKGKYNFWINLATILGAGLSIGILAALLLHNLMGYFILALTIGGTVVVLFKVVEYKENVKENDIQ